jgi:hypothetical protein
VKKLLVIPVLLVFAFAFPAFADPGPADEVEVILGNCEDGTTILRAHNTQEIELGWLIRIDGQLVDQGRLAPGERVERTYEVALGESHFYRIRLGLQGEGRYFSDEGTADRTNCESESPSPSETQTPPPSETQTPPPTETQTPSVGGGGGNSLSPSVLGGSETRSPGSGGTAFTGPEVGWLIAAGLGLLLLGAAALRFTAGSTR